VVVAFVLAFLVGDAEAGGGRFGGRSLGPGYGSNPRSYSVRPYVRRDGRFVSPHRRSTPNREWRDNWSTKPNVNPYTGKDGTQVNPLSK
jgi:hypothetical protein